MHHMIHSKIHLDTKFTHEETHKALHNLKISILAKKTRVEKTKNYFMAHINTVFLYYLTLVTIGYSLLISHTF